MDDSNERAYMRAPARGSATLSWAGGEATGLVRTLSLSGLLIELEERLPLGLDIVMDIQIPGSPAPVPAKGRVAYAGQRAGEGFRVGIAFRKLEAGTASEIDRYVVAMRRRCRELLHRIEGVGEPDPETKRLIAEIPELAAEAGGDTTLLQGRLRRMLAGFRLRRTPWPEGER
jgi:hypothetical protein